MRFVMAARGMAIGAVQADQAPRGLVGAILDAAFDDDGLGRGFRWLQATGEDKGQGRKERAAEGEDRFQGTATVKATESFMLSRSS
jgi:hypothetical protein